MHKTMTHAVNRSTGSSPYTRFRVQRYVAHDAASLPSSDVIQFEDVLTVWLDDRIVCSLSCSPDHLEELVYGHLLTQGLISSKEDITELSVNSSISGVIVRTAKADRPGVVGSDSPLFLTTASARVQPQPLASTPCIPIPWVKSQITKLACTFALDKTSHARTGGCHSAYLANSSGILCVREDIGRHNAFDKVVGWALLHNVDLSSCLLFTSGRVPTDMVAKAIRAHIPILVSKTVTTDKAIAMAQSHGLILICRASPDSFELVSGAGPESEELATCTG